jgi:hypothetical protein
MSDTPPDMLSIVAARDGGYYVVGRDKVVRFAGDLAAATSYVTRTILKVERPLPQVRSYQDFGHEPVKPTTWRPSLFA